MSIRIAAASRYLERTSGLLNYNSAYTRAGFFYLAADRNDYGHFFVSSDAGGDFSDYEHCGVGSDGTSFRIEVAVGGSSQQTTSSITLSVGSWYFLGMRRSNTTTYNGFVIPIGTVPLAISVTSNVGLSVSGRTAIQHMEVGNIIAAGASEHWMNGRYAGLKEWSAYLTDSELLAEAARVLPVRATNLNAWYPIPNIPGNLSAFTDERVKDWSGNGYHWTNNSSSITNEDSPPVGWGGAAIWLPFAAGGADTTLGAAASGSVAAAGSLTTGITPGAAATAVATAQANLSAAITLAAAVTASIAATGAAQTSITAAAAAAGTASAAGAVSTAITPAAAAQGVVQAAAGLTTQITPAATASLSINASAALDGAALMAGAATGAAAAAGALSTAISASGAAQSAASTTATLTTGISLAAAAPMTAQAQASFEQLVVPVAERTRAVVIPWRTSVKVTPHSTRARVVNG